jgi:hypothetical protein
LIILAPWVLFSVALAAVAVRLVLTRGGRHRRARGADGSRRKHRGNRPP